MNAQQKPIGKLLNMMPDLKQVARPVIPRARRLQRSHAPISYWCQWACLVAIFVGSLYLASSLVGLVSAKAGLTAMHKIELLVALCLALVVYPKFGIFRRLRPPGWAFAVISCSWVCVLALTFSGLYVIDVVSKPDAVFLVWSLLVLLIQPLVSIAGQAVMRLIRNNRSAEVRSVVVGTGALASGLVARLEHNPFVPDSVIGLVEIDSNGVRPAANELELLGNLKDLNSLIEKHQIDRIYVAVPMEQSAQVAEVQRLVKDSSTDIVWVPDTLSLTLLNPGLMEISGYPLLSLSESPMGYFGNAFAKSLLDVVVATCMLVVLSPVMLLSAVAIKLTSPGPVFYWQNRHGWDGSVFRIYKFRSMVVHEEKDGYVSQATKNDARVTRVGGWLRRTSIDELPQLFNVLNGTMSLVGPRPHAVIHNEGYAPEIKSYMLRHRIKPGITGLAQVNGFRGETNSIDLMRDRVRYDLQYINDWSIWRDILVIVRTPIALLSNRAVH